MPTGTIKKWVDGKGFGFIAPDDGGEDVFVHFKAIESGEESLEEGTPVTFEVRFDDRKGKYAAESCSVQGGSSGGGGGGGYGKAASKGDGGGYSPYGGKGYGKGGGKGGDW